MDEQCRLNPAVLKCKKFEQKHAPCYVLAMHKVRLTRCVTRHRDDPAGQEANLAFVEWSDAHSNFDGGHGDLVGDPLFLKPEKKRVQTAELFSFYCLLSRAVLLKNTLLLSCKILPLSSFMIRLNWFLSINIWEQARHLTRLVACIFHFQFKGDDWWADCTKLPKEASKPVWAAK